MLTVAVVEDKNGKLASKIEKLMDNKAKVRQIQRGTGYFDIVVWSEKSGSCKPKLSARSLISCCDRASCGCRADMAISCGMSDRDTVTLSSSLDGGMAALQREITTLSGETISPCEIPVAEGLSDIEDKLVLASLNLVINDFHKIPVIF